MSTDARWYVQREGKAQGPFSLQDLKDQVRQNLLRGHDLVFCEGSAEWKRAYDWPNLGAEIFSEQRTSFTGLFTLPPGEDGEGWVVLIRRQEGKSIRFDQEGPVSTEKVRELLAAGTAKPNDHVWKKGLHQWVAIYSLPEFSPSLWNLKDESVPLLQAVVETDAPEEKNKVEYQDEPSVTNEDYMPRTKTWKAEEPAPAPVPAEEPVPTVEASPSPTAAPPAAEPVPAAIPPERKLELVPTPTPLGEDELTPVTATPPAGKPQIPKPIPEPVRPVAIATADTQIDVKIPEIAIASATVEQTIVAPRKKTPKPSILAKETLTNDVSAKFQLPAQPEDEFTETLIDRPQTEAPPKMPPPVPPRPSSNLHGKEWLIGALVIVGLVGLMPIIKQNLVAHGLWTVQKAEPLTPEQITDGRRDQASSMPETLDAAPTTESPATIPPDAAPIERPAAAAMAPSPSPPAVPAAPPVVPVAPPPAAKSTVPNPPPAASAPSKSAREGKNVAWSFALPAEPGTSLTVVVTGFSGQVLDVDAVNLRLNLFLPNNRRLLLEPRSLQLPEGEYVVQIFQGSRQLARSEQEYILDADRFQKKILQHRKQIAYDQQEEKRALLRSLDSLQKFLTSHRNDLGGKTKNPKSQTALLKSFAALNRGEVRKLHQSRHALMYPSGWASFAAQYESIRSMLENGSRSPAAKQDWETMKKRILQTRAQVSQTSLWPKDD